MRQKKMILQKLSLLNYKNFTSQSFDFDPKINCFVGLNGVGKTNVLDAIYHLSFGKSYFNPITLQNIKHGEDFFVTEGGGRGVQTLPAENYDFNKKSLT